MVGDGSGIEESLELTLVEVDLVDGSGLVVLELVGLGVGPEGGSGVANEGAVLGVVVDATELDAELGVELGAGVEGTVDSGATEPEEGPVGAGPVGSGVTTVSATGGTLVLNEDLSKYSCNALISNVSPSNVCLRHSS